MNHQSPRKRISEFLPFKNIREKIQQNDIMTKIKSSPLHNIYSLKTKPTSCPAFFSLGETGEMWDKKTDAVNISSYSSLLI